MHNDIHANTNIKIEISSRNAHQVSMQTWANTIKDWLNIILIIIVI